MTPGKMENDAAAKMEILEDDGEVVVLTLDGVTPFYQLLKTMGNDDASFTINESCSLFYATEDDERFIICRQDDLVLVVELSWSDEITGIKILEVDPDNHTPIMVN